MIAPFLLIFFGVVAAFFLLVLVLITLTVLGAGYEEIEKLPFLKRKRPAKQLQEPEHEPERQVR